MKIVVGIWNSVTMKVAGNAVEQNQQNEDVHENEQLRKEGFKAMATQYVSICLSV